MFGLHGPIELCCRIILFDELFEIIQRYFEKFFTWVYFVDAFGLQCSMQVGFKLYGILRENEAMDIELERNTGIAELIDSFLRIQASGHADLEYIVTK